MMEFMPIRTSRVLDARGVANGLFGLNKSPTKQRLLFDGRRGNASLRPMSAVQRCYEDVLASDPVRACGLRAKAFNLFSPSSLAHLPPDVGTHVGSDLSDFFHFIEVPPWMRAHQHLEPELAMNLGLDPRVVGLWVEPVLTTLGMGFCYATLIAQLVHERLLVPSLSRVMRLRKPLHVSPAHSEAFETAAAEADDDGLVLISNVPPSLLAGCLAHLSPPEMDQSVDASMLDWRVPLSCLAYEERNQRTLRTIALRSVALTSVMVTWRAMWQRSVDFTLSGCCSPTCCTSMTTMTSPSSVPRIPNTASSPLSLTGGSWLLCGCVRAEGF